MGINYKGSPERAAVYGFSLLCAGYVIASDWLKATSIALWLTVLTKDSSSESLCKERSTERYLEHIV